MRNLGQRLSLAFGRFMTGRYGTDKLNNLLLGLGLGTCFVNILVGNYALGLVLTAVSYGFMILALYRCFSRNTYKRYRENRKYLLLVERIRDREHRYFTCPRCRQTVRVPRGKGKIAITCPKCKEKFTKKT
jgi:hypothetical protein